jgi:hypothetical protein
MVKQTARNQGFVTWHESSNVLCSSPNPNKGQTKMITFLGFLVSFVSATAGTDSIQIDRVEHEPGTVAIATIYVGNDGDTVEFPTVEGRKGLKEGQRIGCETVGPRLDGTSVVICGGSVAAYIDIDGSRRANPYFKGTTYTVSNKCGQE